VAVARLAAVVVGDPDDDCAVARATGEHDSAGGGGDDPPTERRGEVEPVVEVRVPDAIDRRRGLELEARWSERLGQASATDGVHESAGRVDATGIGGQGSNAQRRE
jgi:hypothetical protein